VAKKSASGKKFESAQLKTNRTVTVLHIVLILTYTLLSFFVFISNGYLSEATDVNLISAWTLVGGM